MNYRNDRHGDPISILGYGCMRFSKKGGSLDFDKAEKEMMRAYELGVNYYDTAYVYPGSEELVGAVLEKNGIRDNVRIATKLPQYLVRKEAAFDKYFNEELRRLRTDRIDYYLMHMFTDIAEFENLDRLGIRQWIADKKAAGQIRNIGFSYHGNTEMFLKVLEAYDWDFCQIQYNYLDEHTQAGRTGLMAAADKGIPVVIMEPLRGGKLTNLLPEEALKLMREYGREHTDRSRTPAEWGLGWLWDQPEVTCVLSGMNSVEMVEENCALASRVQAGSWTAEEHELIEKVRVEINRKMKVGCTGCGYCMPCPQGVDIPGNFRCYNRIYTENRFAGFWEYYQTMALRREAGFASQCVGCGKCEKHCPQSIEIRKELKAADRALRPLPLRAGLAVVRKFLFR